MSKPKTFKGSDRFQELDTIIIDKNSGLMINGVVKYDETGAIDKIKIYDTIQDAQKDKGREISFNPEKIGIINIKGDIFDTKKNDYSLDGGKIGEVYNKILKDTLGFDRNEAYNYFKENDSIPDKDKEKFAKNIHDFEASLSKVEQSLRDSIKQYKQDITDGKEIKVNNNKFLKAINENFSEHYNDLKIYKDIKDNKSDYKTALENVKKENKISDIADLKMRIDFKNEALERGLDSIWVYKENPSRSFREFLTGKRDIGFDLIVPICGRIVMSALKGLFQAFGSDKFDFYDERYAKLRFGIWKDPTTARENKKLAKEYKHFYEKMKADTVEFKKLDSLYENTKKTIDDINGKISKLEPEKQKEKIKELEAEKEKTLKNFSKDFEKLDKTNFSKELEQNIKNKLDNLEKKNKPEKEVENKDEKKENNEKSVETPDNKENEKPEGEEESESETEKEEKSEDEYDKKDDEEKSEEEGDDEETDDTKDTPSEEDTDTNEDDSKDIFDEEDELGRDLVDTDGIEDILVPIDEDDDDGKYEDLNNRIDELGKDIDGLKNELASKDKKIDDFENIIKGLENKLNEAEKKNDDLENKNKKLENKNSELENKNNELENKNKDLENKNSELESKNEELENKNSALENKAETLENANKGLEDKNAELTNKVNELENNKNEKPNENSGIEIKTDKNINLVDFESVKSKGDFEKLSKNYSFASKLEQQNGNNRFEVGTDKITIFSLGPAIEQNGMADNFAKEFSVDRSENGKMGTLTEVNSPIVINFENGFVDGRKFKLDEKSGNMKIEDYILNRIEREKDGDVSISIKDGFDPKDVDVKAELSKLLDNDSPDLIDNFDNAEDFKSNDVDLPENDNNDNSLENSKNDKFDVDSDDFDFD